MKIWSLVKVPLCLDKDIFQHHCHISHDDISYRVMSSHAMFVMHKYLSHPKIGSNPNSILIICQGWLLFPEPHSGHNSPHQAPIVSSETDLSASLSSHCHQKLPLVCLFSLCHHLFIIDFSLSMSSSSITTRGILVIIHLIVSSKTDFPAHHCHQKLPPCCFRDFLRVIITSSNCLSAPRCHHSLSYL